MTFIFDSRPSDSPLVESIWRTRSVGGKMQGLSLRSVQRRFLYVTGLTYKSIQQIERARHVSSLLQSGVPIPDAAFQAGYFDQPHLTRSLKLFAGQTPAQIVKSNQNE